MENNLNIESVAKGSMGMSKIYGRELSLAFVYMNEPISEVCYLHLDWILTDTRH